MSTIRHRPFRHSIEFLQLRARVLRGLADYQRAVDDGDPMLAKASDYEQAADDAIVSMRVLLRSENPAEPTSVAELLESAAFGFGGLAEGLERAGDERAARIVREQRAACASAADRIMQLQRDLVDALGGVA